MSKPETGPQPKSATQKPVTRVGDSPLLITTDKDGRPFAYTPPGTRQAPKKRREQ